MAETTPTINEGSDPQAISRLEELEQTLRAIRSGEVDALIVSSSDGDRVFTLQGAEHPYRILIESMNEGALTVSTEGAILYANRRFADMTGVPLERLLGASLFNIITDCYSTTLRSALKRAEDAPQKLECEVQNAHGDPVPVNLSLSAMRESEFSGITLIATDLTEQKRREVELARLNEKLETEIGHRIRAEESLRREEESLRQLSGRLLQLQDEERKRLARDLHDSTGQKVVGLTLELNLLLQRSRDLSQPTRSALEECLSLSEQVAAEIRTLSYLLHPPLLEEVGLTAAARWYIDGFTRRSRIQVNLEMPTELERMAHDLEITLFRILQEGLTNVHRHSGSSRADVKLQVLNNKVTLEIKDFGEHNDGHGKALAEGTGEMLGVGIRGMRERVRQLGGSLELQTAPTGTMVRATLPMACQSQNHEPTGFQDKSA